MTPFAAIFVPAELRDAVSERAWFAGMLEAERALAAACAAVGLVSQEAAARIADVCRLELYDTGRLAEDGRGLTPDEIKEILLHCAVYCGVPAANGAFAIAQRVLEEDGHA